MPRVICELPNAALEINGVPFEKMEDGRVRSADVEQEIADFFLAIPGYLADGEVAPVINKATVASTTAKPAAKTGKTAKTAAPAAVTEPVVPPVSEPVVPPVADPAADPAAEAGSTAAAESTPAAASGETGATGDAPPADDVF